MTLKIQRQKWLLTACLLVAAAAPGVCAQSADTLYVQSPSNVVHSFALDKVRKLTFTGQDVSVHSTSGGTTAMLYADVVKLAFTPIVGATPSDEPPIDEPPIDEPPIDEPPIDEPISETPTAVASAADYGVQIYPNPVVDNVVIESATDIREVRVFDAQGKLLQLVDNQQVTTTLSLSALPSGVYFVRVVNGQGVHVSKIVKQ
jgi:hypothetical protein